MDHWRIALLGDTGVGKTSLAIQFTVNCFLDVYGRPLLVDNCMSFVEILNLAGHESEADAHASVLMYATTSRTSFDRLERFRCAIHRVRGERGKPIFVLVGNKRDREYVREVSTAEGEALARTSTKTAHGVERVFVSLVRALRRAGTADAAPGERKAKKMRRCVIM
ncbi:P-loop containing nucleoside triphosphate hydrolase protein [Mycena sp. CBHHK59/15]|nr:P-loop containing nucleoside triphosphate hydrolase protein [Mycena sp. CBHHK59/15]